MIAGAHFLLYSQDPDADRAFLRDVLKFHSVDAGRGWLIFAMPPTEMAVHPVDGDSQQSNPEPGMMSTVLYLMCDDLTSTMESLATQQVKCGAVHQERWGIRTTITLPGGGQIGLYQPLHPTAI